MKKLLLAGKRADIRMIRELADQGARKRMMFARKLTFLKLPFAGALVAVGGPQPSTAAAAFARRLRIPIGILWVGSDVAKLARAYEGAARVRARRYVHATCSPALKEKLAFMGIDAIDVSTQGFDAFFDALLNSKRKHNGRAVVSGSSQRVAAFIEDAARKMPDWDFHAAIAGSRAEAWDDALSLITAKRWYRLGDRREGRLFRMAARVALKRRYRSST